VFGFAKMCYLSRNYVNLVKQEWGGEMEVLYFGEKEGEKQEIP